LRTTVTNKNCIHEGIKEQIKFWKRLIPSCSESLSFLSPLKNIIKTYKTNVLICMGVKLGLSL